MISESLVNSSSPQPCNTLPMKYIITGNVLKHRLEVPQLENWVWSDIKPPTLIVSKTIFMLWYEIQKYDIINFLLNTYYGLPEVSKTLKLTSVPGNVYIWLWSKFTLEWFISGN